MDRPDPQIAPNRYISSTTSNVPIFHCEYILSKYVCGSSCSHYLPKFKACEFPIARHTHPCIAIQWNLVGKERYQILAQDHGLVPNEIGYFSQKQLRQRGRVDYQSLKP